MARYPTFRAIGDIKGTSRNVVPVFTAKEWAAAMKGVPSSRRKPGNSIARARYQEAPWGRGDMIVHHSPAVVQAFDGRCIPEIGVNYGPTGELRISWRYRCVTVPQPPVGQCELIIRAFPGAPPPGISPWECEQDTCSGSCELGTIGTPADGEIVCFCR